MPYHIIVTGSRTIEDNSVEADYIRTVLLQGIDNIASLSQGECKGVDLICKQWAYDNHVLTHDYPADWANNGKAAGPIRNRHMIRETIKKYGKNNVIVLAFTDKPLEKSTGTSHCVFYAENNDLTVYKYRTDLHQKVS